MKQIFLTTLALLAAYPAMAQVDSGSSKFTCPSDYALSIDPPPPLTDDPAQPDAHPKTALEKQQAEDQARTNEMSRWHCVPLSSLQSKR
jgi:hypothetical protein